MGLLNIRAGLSLAGCSRGLVFALALASGFAATASDVVAQEAGSSVIYLVRHTEKAVGDPADPLLSAEGTARAELVAHMLMDIPLSNVFSTPYRRTLHTAEPSALAHGLEITSYDPRSREETMGLVEMLRTTPGHHLVVGHSNTTPEMVQALGGDPISPIDEDEYDRLYIVTIGPDGTVSSSMIRFGAPFEGTGGE